MATFKQKPLDENPFRPGPGEVPPLLAGRAPEQEAIGIRIRGLSKRGTTRPFTIYGPRGMGKTVLLDWVQKEYGGKGKGKAAVIYTRATKMLKSEELILDTLFAQKRVTSQVATTVQGRVPKVAKGSVTRTQVALDRRWADLERNLVAACRKKPIVLLVDEAQAVDEIDRGLYQEFLNAWEDVARQAPFLLMLAGTPDLPYALRSLEAGFIERAEYLGIGLLEQSEAERAIREPLADDGIDIAADALAFAVAEAQRYPYFLQSWGRALWKAAMTQGKPQLTLPDAEAARKEPQRAKSQHYATRYGEVIENHRIKAAALAVSKAFQQADHYYAERLLDFIEEALAPHLPAGEAVDEAAWKELRALQRLGFVWEGAYEDVVRPGIPSLMDYTLARRDGG